MFKTKTLSALILLSLFGTAPAPAVTVPKFPIAATPPGAVNLPAAVITVDGNPADWGGIQPLTNDPQGDSSASYTGDDIKAVYAAKDANNLYIRLDLWENANTNFGNGPAPNDGRYSVKIANNGPYPYMILGVAYDVYHTRTRWELGYNGSNGGTPASLAGPSYVGVSGGVIEIKVPLSMIGSPSVYERIDAAVENCCSTNPVLTLDDALFKPTGREMTRGLAFDGTNYLVGVQGDTMVGARLISQSGSYSSPTLWTGRTGGAPLVSFDGQNYLVAWSDDMGPDLDIWGMIINKSGSPVKGPFAINTTPGAQSLEGLIFNGTDYFMVWVDYRSGSPDVYGQLVDKQGNPGTEVMINAGPIVSGSASATVAYDGTNMLAAWDVGSSVMGRFIDRFGQHAGVEFVIDYKTDTCNNTYDGLSSAFDHTNYLIVWNDRPGDCSTDSDIYGRLVGKTGVFPGARFVVSAAPGQQELPFAAFNGGSYYYVAWTDGRNDANRDTVCGSGEGTCFDIWGALVSTSGGLLGSEFPIVSEGGNQFLSPVLFASGKNFIAWTSGDWFDGAVGDVFGIIDPNNIQTYFEDNDPAITYSGNWLNYNCPQCSYGSMSISNKTMASAEFTFTGRGIKWIVTKGPLLGKARVYLDGNPAGFVDLYSPANNFKAVLQKTGLSPGPHTLRLEVSGQKNASSTGYYIDIDAFDILQ